MTEREKVIYSIERCICHVPDACRDCAYDAEHPYNECVEMLLRDALTLLKAQKSGWISVDERLPERGIMVLTAVYGTDLIVPMDGETPEDAMERCLHRPARASIGFVDEDGCWCGADGWPDVIQPKFWMPLPEPPKEE